MLMEPNFRSDVVRNFLLPVETGCKFENFNAVSRQSTCMFLSQPPGKSGTQLEDVSASVSPEEELPLTKPWKGVHNRGLDNENHDLILKTNEFLVNAESRTK